MDSIDREMAWWIIFIGSFVVLDLVLRGYGMWKAAQHHDQGWFVAMMLLSTAGILPLIYLESHRDEA